MEKDKPLLSTVATVDTDTVDTDVQISQKTKQIGMDNHIPSASSSIRGAGCVSGIFSGLPYG